MGSIDCSDLVSTLSLIPSNEIDQFKRNVLNLIELKKIDNKRISIHGCKIDVTTVINNRSTSEEIVNGWNILQDSISMDILSRLLLLNTIYKNLMITNPGEITVNNDILISNKAPDVIVLLSLCYWVNICKNLMDADNFKIKMSELNHNFAINSLNQVYQEVSKLEILRVKSIDKEFGENYAKSKFYNIKQWVETIVSFTSEFMLCSIIKQLNLDVSFIPSANNIKRCDLLVKEYHIEIKSIIDPFEYGVDIAKSLSEELLGTLQRSKITSHLNDSLQKEKLDFVILNVASSSLGMGITKYTNNEEKNFYKFLEKCFEYSLISRKYSKKFLPVLILSYYINSINSHFIISPCIVKYPIKDLDGIQEVDEMALVKDSLET